MADRLFYFYRSADKPPGRGVNEFVQDPNLYYQLRRIPNWRKMLSNLWVAPFECEGLVWNGVEFMFQAYKLNIVDPDLAYTLSISSGSEVSKGDGLVAVSMRKARILNAEQLDEWNQLRPTVLEAALYAKFSQHPDLQRVLVLTHPAELWHSAGRFSQPTRQYQLERIRSYFLLTD